MSDNQNSEQADFYAKFLFTGYHVIIDLAKDISRCYLIVFAFQLDCLYNMSKSILLFLTVYQLFVLVVICPLQQTWMILQKVLKINFLNLIGNEKQESLWCQILPKSESMLLNLAGYLHSKIEKLKPKSTRNTKE
jgi:hypothetical protein